MVEGYISVASKTCGKVRVVHIFHARATDGCDFFQQRTDLSMCWTEELIWASFLYNQLTLALRKRRRRMLVRHQINGFSSQRCSGTVRDIKHTMQSQRISRQAITWRLREMNPLNVWTHADSEHWGMKPSPTTTQHHGTCASHHARMFQHVFIRVSAQVCSERYVRAKGRRQHFKLHIMFLTIR